MRRANAEEKPGLAALIPVYVAGGTFFMILHLSGGLMTVFAERNTDRRAEWIPAATEFYAQKAMPSYFVNAGERTPRPDERTLVVMPEQVEAMFGARILSEGAVGDAARGPGAGRDGEHLAGHAGHRRRAGLQGLPGRQRLAGRVARRARRGDDHREGRSREGRAHGQGRPHARRDGAAGAGHVVSPATYDAVYAKAGAGTPRLEPGRYVRLVNAEILTGFLNPFFVVVLTPVVVWFFAGRVKAGKPVSTARKIFYGMLITMVSLLVMALGASRPRRRRQDLDDVAGRLLHDHHRRRALPVADGPVAGDQAGARARLVGLMMGGWFLSTAVGNKMSGFISGLEPGTHDVRRPGAGDPRRGGLHFRDAAAAGRGHPQVRCLSRTSERAREVGPRPTGALLITGSAAKCRDLRPNRGISRVPDGQSLR